MWFPKENSVCGRCRFSTTRKSEKGDFFVCDSCCINFNGVVFSGKSDIQFCECGSESPNPTIRRYGCMGCLRWVCAYCAQVHHRAQLGFCRTCATELLILDVDVVPFSQFVKT